MPTIYKIKDNSLQNIILDLERGVVKKSVVYYSTPSSLAKTLLFYPLHMGNYTLDETYLIRRTSYHLRYILFYIKEGSMSLSYRGSEYVVGKGKGFIIDCFSPHIYKALETTKCEFLHFDGVGAAPLYDHIYQNFGPTFSSEKAMYIKNTFTKFFDAYDGIAYHHTSELKTFNQTMPIENVKSKNYHLLSFIDFSASIYNILMTLMKPTTDAIDEETPVETAMKYITSNIDKILTLDEISDYVGFSKYYLSHLFKRVTGYGILEYIISIKVDKAKYLLDHTHQTIASIGYALGYENPGTFINLFKRKVGISPLSYRKKSI